MRFLSLSSGSKGNCTLISTDRTNVLIDCGISGRKTAESLKALGIAPEDIDALVLTHEHSDHIRGAKRLMQCWGIPVYGTGGTLAGLKMTTGDVYFESAGRKLMEEVSYEREFTIGDISFLPFRTYHDASEPCGYRMEIFQDKPDLRKHVEVAVLTDCGHFDERIISVMKLLDAMILEANHDVGMLLNGRYPAFLKRRILSPSGHLSNDSGGKLLAGVISPRLKQVLLGHLSHENNTHELALKTVRDELVNVYGTETSLDIDISVAPEGEVSRLIEL